MYLSLINFTVKIKYFYIFFSTFLFFEPCKILSYNIPADSINNTKTTEKKIRLTAGISISESGGMNLSGSQRGRKSLFEFNSRPDFEVVFGFDYINKTGIIKNIGCSVGVSYIRLSYATESESIYKGEKNPRLAVEKHDYIIIFQNLNWYWLDVGLDFGFPVKSSFDKQTGFEGISYDNQEIPPDRINNMEYIHFGATFTLFENGNLGRFLLLIRLGYSLTGIYNNYSSDDPIKYFIMLKNEKGEAIEPEEVYNPHPVMISVGLRYEFDILSSD